MFNPMLLIFIFVVMPGTRKNVRQSTKRKIYSRTNNWIMKKLRSTRLLKVNMMMIIPA